MDGETLRADLEEAKRTELSRLGSDKALLALTDATLETERVLSVVAGTERALSEAFAEWAEQASSDRARTAFADAASEAESHVERLTEDLDGAAPTEDVAALAAGPESDVERVAAALVAQSLVSDRTLLQAVNFFVNEADERRADLVRDVRAAVDDRAGDGAATLAELCADEDDWDRAREAATAVVEAAYESYVEALEGMGLDPKPVC